MAAKTYLSVRLREARKNAGLTVKEVGKSVGRSGKTVEAWEAGTTEPSAELLIDLCKLYDVSISFFFPPTVQPTVEYAIMDMSNETELLDIYHSVSKDGQRALMAAARAMANEYSIVEK